MSRAERLDMLEKDHPELSRKEQAELVGVSYSSLFYKPVPPTERELAIKRRIDEIYTAHPYYGSRKILEVLRPEFGVARPTIQRYMREMGIFALVPGPHTSKPAPEHRIFPYLLRNVIAEHPNEAYRQLATYIYFYNFERPHQALDYQTPSQLDGTVIDCNLNTLLRMLP